VGIEINVLLEMYSDRSVLEGGVCGQAKSED
jgi:hypothetical protein